VREKKGTVADVILELASVKRDIEAIVAALHRLVDDQDAARTLRLALENTAKRLDDAIRCLREGCA